MSEEKKGVVVREVREVTGLSADDPNACWLDIGRFEQIQRVAKVFSECALAPAHYKGKLADCIIAVQMAVRMGVDPFMFMQHTYVIGGKLGIEAQLKIALVNQRKTFDGPIQWRFEGERLTPEWTCTAFATDRRSGALCEMPITWAMVKAEGWLEKANSKWKTIPEKMFRWRSASWLIDVCDPEAALGLPASDDLEDAPDRIINVPSSPALPPPVEADPAKFAAPPVAEPPKPRRGRPPKAQSDVQPEQDPPPPEAQEPAQEARHRKITLLLGQPPAPADEEELYVCGLNPNGARTVWTGNDSSDARDLAAQLFAEVREHA